MTPIRFTCVAILLSTATLAFADEYTEYKRDEKKQTLTCEYSYEAKDPKTKEPKKQTVVIHYGDKDRAGWAYFYNGDTPWARCAVPGNPKYDAKAMHWEALKGDGKGYEPFKDKKGEAYPSGYCPAPKDGKNPIKELPLPPK